MTDPEPPIWTQEREMVKRHVEQLSEHFDAVHVFVSSTVPGEDKTRHYQTGKGNWFARYGQVREWLIQEDERSKVELRKNEEE